MANNNFILKSFETHALVESIDQKASASCLHAKQGGKSQSPRSCTFTLCSRSSLPDIDHEFHENTQFEAIYGVYHLLRGSYVALVVESEVWVSLSLPKINIRKTKKIAVVPLFQSEVVLSESQQSDENRYLALLKQGFTEHSFFYSADFDLTHSQQRLAKLRLSKGLNTAAPWKTADSRFFWNLDVISDLIACAATKWIVPFMSAHIEVRPDCVIDEHSFTLLFISRRSRYNQGCRFFKRGIDNDGNVANFVETEQMLLFPDGRVTSYVQIRGSIPIIWRSLPHMKYAPEVKMESSIQKSISVATLHVRNILDAYSDAQGRAGVLFVNLIDSKGEQGMLGSAFKTCIDEVKTAATSRMHAVDFVWFDFHAETKKKGKWNNLSKIIPLCEKIFQAQGYFAMEADGTVSHWQVGCIRTNCVDNLDRTNVVQSLFARRSIMKQLGKLAAGAAASETGDAITSPYKAFEVIYKTVWANNANSISILYAGTGALKVDFTKTGKRTMAGVFADGVNSCKRYYINNFTDGVKQDAIDLMLGTYVPNLKTVSPFNADTNHDDLSTSGLKFFFLVLVLFSLRALTSTHCSNPIYLKQFMKQALQALLAVLTVLMFLVVKKGSSVGKRLVITNRLLQYEPLR